MWSVIFLALLLATWLGFYLVYQAQQTHIEAARLKMHEVEEEERRVFAFLHGLGEAFSAELLRGDLHRLIVEGAMQVLDAHGGVLYLIDRSQKLLLVGCISKDCPLLVSVPDEVIQQAATAPGALESHLRLHPVKVGEGMIGETWTTQEPRRIFSIPDEPTLAGQYGKTESVMLCPLVFGGQNLGVLAVANGPLGSPFSQSDFEVFKAIAEQSAFALYNAVVYHEAGEKKRLETDLSTAREIQCVLLPSSSPVIDGYELSGTTLPARYVSGDYFDYIRVDEDRLGIVIADVSGKGVPASLIMAMCRSVLRSHAVGNPSAADVLRKVNRQLYPDIREDMFISLAYVILNHRTKQLTLCRAGHDAPLLFSSTDRSVMRLNPPGMAIGIDSGGVFDRVTGDFSVNMEERDCLLLYTDGLTEAVDEKGLEYGMSRTIQGIQSNAEKGAHEIVSYLTEDLRNFVGNTPQYDDVTLIAIRRL